MNESKGHRDCESFYLDSGNFSHHLHDNNNFSGGGRNKNEPLDYHGSDLSILSSSTEDDRGYNSFNFIDNKTPKKRLNEKNRGNVEIGNQKNRKENREEEEDLSIQKGEDPSTREARLQYEEARRERIRSTRERIEIDKKCEALEIEILKREKLRRKQRRKKILKKFTKPIEFFYRIINVKETKNLIKKEN